MNTFQNSYLSPSSLSTSQPLVSLNLSETFQPGIDSISYHPAQMNLSSFSIPESSWTSPATHFTSPHHLEPQGSLSFFSTIGLSHQTTTDGQASDSLKTNSTESLSHLETLVSAETFLDTDTPAGVALTT